MTKNDKRIVRHRRVRAKIAGTEARPRLAVFRSNKFLYVQVINDETATTIASTDTKSSKAKTPVERAQEAGKTIGEALKNLKVESVVFDRGGFIYAGAVKAVAEGVRESGITV
jgi:large subunit ribosomal protein L18